MKGSLRGHLAWSRMGLCVEFALALLASICVCVGLYGGSQLMLAIGIIVGTGPVAWLATLALLWAFSPPPPETEAPNYILTGPLTGLIERVFFASAIGFDLSGAAVAMIAWLTLKNTNLWPQASHPDNIGDRWLGRIDFFAGFVSLLGATWAGLVLRFSLGQAVP